MKKIMSLDIKVDLILQKMNLFERELGIVKKSVAQLQEDMKKLEKRIMEKFKEYPTTHDVIGLFDTVKDHIIQNDIKVDNYRQRVIRLEEQVFHSAMTL